MLAVGRMSKVTPQRLQPPRPVTGIAQPFVRADPIMAHGHAMPMGAWVLSPSPSQLARASADPSGLAQKWVRFARGRVLSIPDVYLSTLLTSQSPSVSYMSVSGRHRGRRCGVRVLCQSLEKSDAVLNDDSKISIAKWALPSLSGVLYNGSCHWKVPVGGGHCEGHLLHDRSVVHSLLHNWIRHGICVQPHFRTT